MAHLYVHLSHPSNCQDPRFYIYSKRSSSRIPMNHSSYRKLQFPSLLQLVSGLQLTLILMFLYHPFQILLTLIGLSCCPRPFIIKFGNGVPRAIPSGPPRCQTHSLLSISHLIIPWMLGCPDYPHRPCLWLQLSELRPQKFQILEVSNPDYLPPATQGPILSQPKT